MSSECSICLDSYRGLAHLGSKPSVEVTHQDGTKHDFHEECIKESVKRNSACPLCRKTIYQIKDEFTHPVDPAPSEEKQIEHNEKVKKAILNGNFDRFNSLLSKHSITDTTRSFGVYLAAYKGDVKITETLLATGPVSKLTRELASSEAKKEGHEEVAQILNPSFGTKALHLINKLIN